MPVSVRRFTADEWRTYRALRLRALTEDPDSFGSSVGYEAALPDEHWQERLANGATTPSELPLLALVDDTPAGLTWGRITDESPDVAHIYQVWVAAEHRGLGLGRLLMETAIAWARAFGVRAVVLDVTVGNSAAEELYRRFGFVEVGDAKPMRAELRSQVMELVFASQPTARSSSPR